MFLHKITETIVCNRQKTARNTFRILKINLNSCRSVIYKDNEFPDRDAPLPNFHLHQKDETSSNSAVKRIAFDSLAFVDKLLRMDEVKKAQDNVMDVKMRLKETGERKREILRDLAGIRNQLILCTEQSHRVQRGSKEFIDAVYEERKLSDSEKMKQIQFENLDEEERKLFNSLTLAINYSYEKERLYSNTIRNLGIIGTVLASVLSFIGATIGYYLHNKKSGVIINNVEQIIESKLDDFKNDLNTEMFHRIFQQDKSQPESWGSYLNRHASGIYRWFWPK